MARRAREIMESQVLSVSPETALVDVLRLFVEGEIHGAPVVAGDGSVVGIITSADLLRAITEEHEAGRSTSAYLRDAVEFSAPDWSRMPDDFQDRLSELRAEDHMTREVVSVDIDAPVTDVARTMAHDRVHRVLVLDGDRLAGIVSTFDLIALLEKQD